MQKAFAGRMRPACQCLDHAALDNKRSQPGAEKKRLQKASIEGLDIPKFDKTSTYLYCFIF